MSDEQPERTTDDLVRDAVQATFPGDIVTRYLLVAETIDPESSRRAAVTLVDDGSSPWDVYGLARYAIGKEDAGLVEHRLRDD